MAHPALYLDRRARRSLALRSARSRSWNDFGAQRFGTLGIRLDSFDAATNTIVADIGAVFAVRQALVE